MEFVPRYFKKSNENYEIKKHTARCAFFVRRNSDKSVVAYKTAILYFSHRLPVGGPGSGAGAMADRPYQICELFYPLAQLKKSAVRFLCADSAQLSVVMLFN